MEIPYTFAGLPPLPLEKARVAILPVAYDSTTSYQAGTRFGPQEIILASRFLEMYDESLGFEPSDLEIATLPELWPDLSRPEAAVNEVEKYVTKILKKTGFPGHFGRGTLNNCRGGKGISQNISKTLGPDPGCARRPKESIPGNQV